MADLWRTFLHKSKISPGWWGWVMHSARPPPFQYIYHHIQSYSVRSSWEGQGPIHSSYFISMYSVKVTVFCVHTAAGNARNTQLSNPCTRSGSMAFLSQYKSSLFPPPPRSSEAGQDVGPCQHSNHQPLCTQSAELIANNPYKSDNSAIS